MRNDRAIKQRNKQRVKGYFHLCSSNIKETHEGRKLILQEMEVTRWFSMRHDGDTKHKRYCIKQSIARLRLLKDNFLSNVNHACTH